MEGIFARFPDLRVTGIDLTAEMLAKLREKFPDKRLALIEGDYFCVDFGAESFDAAVSFQSLHHFAPEKKRALFARLAKALKPGGVYVQCDYAAESEESEARYFQEFARLKREAHLPEDAFYHYDTPLTEREIYTYIYSGLLRGWKRCGSRKILRCLWHVRTWEKLKFCHNIAVIYDILSLFFIPKLERVRRKKSKKGYHK